MSNPKYSCVIPGCTESKFTRHYLTHLMGHSKEELQKSLGINLKIGAKGSLLKINPKINGESKSCAACFGCKKFFNKISLQEKHRDECNNKNKHKLICSKMLDNDENPVIDETPKIKELEEKIKRLENQVKSLKQNAAMDKETIDEADETQSSVHNILDQLNEEHYDVYKKMIEFMELNHPTVLSKYQSS